MVSRSPDDRIDWPTRKAAKVAGTHRARTASAYPIALPHSTGSRAGTAAKLVRIVPVAYSPVISSAPSTPMASWARLMPLRLIAVGSKLAMAAGSCGGLVTRTPAYSAPMPTISTAATSSDQALEGRVRSLVHSERITRAWVTRWSSREAVGAGAVGTVMVVILSPVRWWARGTRPRRWSGR